MYNDNNDNVIIIATTICNTINLDKMKVLLEIL